MERSAIRESVPALRFAPCGLRTISAGAITRPGVVVSLAKTLRGVEAGDRLHFEIFFQAVLAPFAAVAGLLVAAERRGAVVGHALQVDVAGANLAGDLASALDRPSRDVTGKTIRRVVGDLDGVGLVLGGEDGRTDIEALVDAFGQAGAAGDEGCALVDTLLDQRLDLVPLRAVDDRADGGALAAGIAGLGLVGDALGDRGHFLHLGQRYDH